MTEQDIIFRLQEWFVDQTGGEVDSASPYFESGNLDSLDIIHLVSHIEKLFKVQLQYEDFQSPEFATLAGLAPLIHRRMRNA